MTNYIKKPDYIKNIEDIDSLTFQKVNFEKYYNHTNKSYSVDLLADIYKQSKGMFFNLRDELLLRGFSIQIAPQSNLFPEIIQPETIEKLSVNKETRNYQNINFKHLNLNNFICRFNVENDMFFDGIPLENFRYINKNIDMQLLKESFLLQGFSVVKEEKQELLEKNKQRIIKEKNKMLISEYFYEGKYERFLDFCEKEEVYYVEDITRSLLMRFAGTPYVGEVKFKEVEERFNEYQDKTDDITKEIDEIFEIDPVSRGTFIIKEYFSDRVFNSFREYTQNKGIKYLEELKKRNIYEYANYPGVGTGRLRDVNNRIEEIKKQINTYYYFDYDLNSFNLHDYYINKIFAVLMMTERLIKDIRIDTIYQKDIRELSMPPKDKKNLLKLSAVLSKLLSPNEIIGSFLRKQNEVRLKTLKYRFDSNKSYSLEKIGMLLPYQGKARSRESIRQNEEKVLNDFIMHMKNYLFRTSLLLTSLSLDYYQNEVFKPSELERFLKKDFKFVLNVLAKDESETIFYYEEDYQLYFLNKKDKENFKQTIEEIVTELPDVFTIDEVKERFKIDYFMNGTLSIHRFLKSNNYQKYGKIYSNKQLTSHELIKFLFKRDLPKDFRVDSDSYPEIIKIFKNRYNYTLDKAMGSIENALEKSDDFILVDSRTYRLLELSDYNMQLLDELVEMIDYELKEKNSIDIEIIFGKYRDELLEGNINTKLHLYSIIKHLYSENYKFGSGISLDIYKNKEEEKTNSDLLINFITENKGVCTREEIENGLGWPDSRITLTAGTTPQIINWGENTYRVVSDWVNKKHAEKTYKIIRDTFDEQGFITENQLYERAQFTPLLQQLIKDEKIDSAVKFRSTFRYYLDELEGNAILITPEESEYETVYDVIMDKFPEGDSRINILNYLYSDLKYKEGTSNSILEKMLEENLFFEINLGKLYPTNKINISEEVIQSVLQFIEEEQNGKEYIVLKSLEGYRSKLPEINMEWTPYMIKQILLNNGYKKIKIFNNDYRTDQLIMVKDDSEFNMIDELIRYILQNDYIGTWEEKDVANYLEEKNILYKKKKVRLMLPVNLYEKSNILDVNKHGFVNLKSPIDK